MLALAPRNLSAILSLALTYLSEANMPAARAAIARAGKPIDPDELVAYLANYYDLVWVLDAAQTERLRRAHTGGLR